MPAPLLIDVSHTSHTRARTGIQRVVRGLHAALGGDAVGVTYDPFQRSWRGLESWELENFNAPAPTRKRSAQWPFAARARGRMRRLLRQSSLLPAETSGLIVPELFSPGVAHALPHLFAVTRGPRVALFHDAIALKLPELTPTKTVARFPAYLRELLVFDGIAAVSDDSRDALLDYWRWLEVARIPPVQTIALGIDPVRPRSESPMASDAPTVLSVGSIEGRKNHVALLDACEELWSLGEQFELRLIGLAQRETGAAALQKIERMRAIGRPIRYDGPADDGTVETAYASCVFTVYPSVMEGFGLPVLESLMHGKPCICSNRGALGEAAGGGGCLTIPTMDASALCTAMRQLLRSAANRERLAKEARARSFKTWSTYAAEITTWMRTLPVRR